MGQTSAAIIKVQGRKVGELTEATATVKSNGQLLPTSDVIIKSRGKPTGEVTFSSVIPTGGMKVDMITLTINQKFIAITMQYHGGMIEVSGTNDQGAIKTNVAQGATDGTFTFSGAVRVIA
jgi:hypothetical protein